MPGANWTAQIGGGSATAFSALKITSCVVNLQAGGEDSAELAFALAASATAPADENDAVIIREGANIYFRGYVVRVEPFADGGREGWGIQCAGLSSNLNRITYRQRYAISPAMTTQDYSYKTRCQLGIDDAGDEQTTAETIADILTYAATESSGVTTGSILSGTALIFPCKRWLTQHAWSASERRCAGILIVFHGSITSRATTISPSPQHSARSLKPFPATPAGASSFGKSRCGGVPCAASS